MQSKSKLDFYLEESSILEGGDFEVLQWWKANISKFSSAFHDGT